MVFGAIMIFVHTTLYLLGTTNTAMRVIVAYRLIHSGYFSHGVRKSALAPHLLSCELAYSQDAVYSMRQLPTHRIACNNGELSFP